MTENKRYFDGSLAKWYYSRDYNGMRVISNGVDEFALNSKKPCKDINSKELKGSNQLLDELNKLEDRIISLKKENEQLKQFKEDVFNKIDMHLRMLPVARDNEFNEEDGDPTLYTGAIYMLETLKKELQE